VGDALDVLERWLVQLFHHTNNSGFLLDVESKTLATFLNPAFFRNQEEQHMQPLRKKSCKIDSDWFQKQGEGI
jgi:hypothetical protein